MMTQRKAVFTAIVSTVEVVPGVAVQLDEKQKEQVHAKLFTMFSEGQVELRGERTADWLRKYIPGLVNNWVRKDPNLNGNTKYTAKNPGSRTGSGDEQIKAMKALLQQPGLSEENIATITAAIEERKAALKPAPEPINVSALPESLRHLVKPTA